jgi:diacylglycerol kinase
MTSRHPSPLDDTTPKRPPIMPQPTPTIRLNPTPDNAVAPLSGVPKLPALSALAVPNGFPRNRFASQSFWQSLGFALEGLGFILKTQRNFRIDVLVATGVIAMSALLQVTRHEWLVLLLVIGLVLCSEAINTAVEYAVDLVTQGEFDMRAKIIKDVSAAACLLMAFTAVAVGSVVLVPYIMQLPVFRLILLG